MSDQTSLTGYKAVKESAGIIDCSDREFIEVSGNDRMDFLHNILTNSIKDLSPGQGCLSALLSPKAEILSFMKVLIFLDHVLLIVEKGQAKITRELLEKFIIMEDVQTEVLKDALSLIHIVGPNTKSILQSTVADLTLPQQNIHHAIKNELTFIADASLGSPGYLILGTAKDLNSLVEKLTNDSCMRNVSSEEYETLRIEQGLLLHGIDMHETVLLPETGYEKSTVSATKGCYPGQEVVAKIETYGGLHKLFVGIKSDQPLNQSKVLHNNSEIGKVTSSCHSPKLNCYLGLALVKNDFDQEGTAVELISEEEKSEGIVITLPLA